MAKKHYVLLVEDDESNAELIRLQLRQMEMNIDLSVIQDKQLLLDRLQQSPPDLIICDYRLPGFTGMDALRIVREYSSNLPFVLVSGYIGEEKAVDAMLAGASDYAMKDNLERLNPIVRRELLRYQKEKKDQKNREEAIANLRERIKEQACLYKISSLNELQFSVNTLLKQAVQLIPRGWQYPDETEARITFNEEQFSTDHFRETQWMIQTESEKLLEGRFVIEVVYTEPKPLEDEGPFLLEERKLLDSIRSSLELKVNQVQARNELKKQQRLLDNAYKMAEIGHWELDLNKDKLNWSKAVKALHEVSPDYKPDLESAIAFYKEGRDRETIINAVDRAIEKGEPFDVELQIITAKGNERWIHAVGEAEFEDGQCYRVYGSTQDITKHKHAEQELISQKERLERSQRIGKISDWDFDVETREISWSPVVYEIFERDTSLGPPNFEELPQYYHEEDWDRFINTVNHAIEMGERYDEDFRLSFSERDDKYVKHIGIPVMDSEGKVTKLIGVVQDITDRKQAELRHARSEQKLTNITSNINGIILQYKLFAGGTDEILYVSKGIETLYELSAEEVLHDSDLMWNQILQDDLEKVKKSVWQNSKTLTEWNQSWRIKTPSGKLKWIQAYGTPFRDEDGNVIWDTLLLDVTEKVNTERDKEVLLKEVHHRVKNNLAIISGLLTLEMYGMDDDQAKLPLQRSINRIQSMAKVHELLYDTSSFSSINLRDYLQQLSVVVRNTFDVKDQVQVLFDLDDLEANINVAIPLGMLVNELMTNSFKYAFENGQGEINIGISKDNGNFHVSYRDNGRGFDEEPDLNAPETLGLTIISTLLKQLGADYRLHTENRFALEFSFEKTLKGSHGNM